MTKQVFISYSTTDTTTEQIRNHLETQGIPCWMAPRDIVPGEDYAEQIINAIEGCPVLLLVLSESSNRSQYVRNEVERAVAKRKVIIPFRIHNVTPSRSLEFFISNAQWIDAWQPPLIDKLSILVAALGNHLYNEKDGAVALSAQSVPLIPSSHQQSTALATQPDPVVARPVFVARESQLTQLENSLAQMLGGHGQLRLITGEAGAGKSALLVEFLHRAVTTHGDVVITYGGCDAQTGAVDAYLPFREALTLLAGGAKSSPVASTLPPTNAARLPRLRPVVGQVVVEHGPHLLDTLVPSAALAGLSGGPKQQRVEQPVLGVPSVEQGQIYEQYVHVLRALALHAPLIVVLEDLHWADVASIGLLFRLGRQLEGSRILVAGTYRTEEVSLGRAGEPHPLEKVVAELQRNLGDIHIDLDAVREREGQTLVDALVDSEANGLDTAFRQALYQHTNGHPLFVVELLRDLERTGALVKDDAGRWVVGTGLEWSELPARVEGMIAVRLARISDEQRRWLTIASVVGERFTAEPVAQVQGMEARQLIQQLSGPLQKQHKLVEAEGVERLRNQRLTLYRFSHNLMQVYLYGKLDEVERVYLHEDVGRALETLYGEQAHSIAVQLAYHYTQAGIQEKAVEYLLQAGDQVRQASANQEALHYYQQALALADGEEVYDSILPRRAQLFLDLFRGKEAIDDYERLLKRARQINNREQECEFLVGLVRAYYLVALDAQEAGSATKMRNLCLEAQNLAGELGNKRIRIHALLTAVWPIDFWPEDRAAALVKVQEAVALSRELGDEELIIASKLALMDLAPWRTQAKVGEALIRELEVRRDLSRLNTIYFYLMWAHYIQGAFTRAVSCCEAGIALARRIGVPPVMYPTIKAWALLGLGRYDEAWVALQQEIADDAHVFGRTFKTMGVGLYLFELTAYGQAIDVFEEVIVQAGSLERAWLQEWARLMLVYALVRGGLRNETDRSRAAQLLAQVDDKVLKGLKSFAASALQLRAELALTEGKLAEGVQQVMESIAMTEAEHDQPRLITALELQARLLLALQQPNEALVLCENALHTATAIDYLPMLWRIQATKAQALAKLGQQTAAMQAYRAAAAVIETVVATIDDAELRHGFLADPLVESIFARIQS